MASFGRDREVLNVKIVKCDIDQQPGLSSIVGIPNSVFINTDPFEANFSLLKLTAILKPVTKVRAVQQQTSNFSFSGRHLQTASWQNPGVQNRDQGERRPQPQVNLSNISSVVGALQQMGILK